MKRIQLGIFLLICLCCQLILTQPAFAVLRQHQDEPGVMRYHSQESLPDDSGKVLQVVLFKQITPGKPTIYNLRLVGFPGIVEFTHPENLEIITASGQIFTATDVYAQGAPAPNVGQYNFTEVLNKITPNQSLRLIVPLQGRNDISLKIPKFLATEWHLLVLEL